LAFLTPEATKTLSRYLESRKIKGESVNDESPIFHSQYRKENQESALKTDFARVTMANLIKASGVKRVRVSKHSFDKSVMYMFRKRFNTILKLNNDVNSNIAEKLMAHKRGLDGTYLQPTREECFAEFVKAIPDLTIDPTQRLKLENKKLEAEKSELEETQMKLSNTEILVKKQMELMMQSPEMLEQIKKTLLATGKYIEKK